MLTEPIATTLAALKVTELTTVTARIAHWAGLFDLPMPQIRYTRGKPETDANMLVDETLVLWICDAHADFNWILFGCPASLCQVYRQVDEAMHGEKRAA